MSSHHDGGRLPHTFQKSLYNVYEIDLTKLQRVGTHFLLTRIFAGFKSW